MKPADKCERCTFFQLIEIAGIADYGTCRRRAPVPAERGSKFPVVDRWNWCGEFTNAE